MIKCEQALIDAFINGSFGLPIAQENAYYKPTEGVAMWSCGPSGMSRRRSP